MTLRAMAIIRSKQRLLLAAADCWARALCRQLNRPWAFCRGTNRLRFLHLGGRVWFCGRACFARILYRLDRHLSTRCTWCQRSLRYHYRYLCCGYVALSDTREYRLDCGLMPITGIPLPFISYGSSFMVVNFVMLGLINSVWVHSGR